MNALQVGVLGAEAVLVVDQRIEVVVSCVHQVLGAVIVRKPDDVLVGGIKFERDFSLYVLVET